MAIPFIDLCSGIGGFHSGLVNTGHYRCVGHAEIDKNAEKAYNAIYGEEGGLNYGDLRTINPRELPHFDLLCGGFPCQSFSVAGRRLGFRDTRGTVFFEIARILAEKRPPFLLLENVLGLLSHDSGRTLNTIFSALVEMGYNLEWMVLNSKYFGVPQQRRRLYIVGYLDPRCAGKVFPLSGGNAKNLKQLIPGPQGQRVYETDGIACTQCAGSGGWGGKTGLYFIDMNADPVITDVARCITARQDSGVSNHRGEHSAVLIEDAPRAILTPDRETVRQQGRRMKEPNEAMFTITAQDMLAVDRDMEVDCDIGHQITCYLETWFDVDKKFGTNTAADDDKWLNLYAKYDPFADTLRLEFTVTTADSCEEGEYMPTDAEAQLIKDMIAEKLQEEYGQTPKEFCEDIGGIEIGGMTQ